MESGGNPIGIPLIRNYTPKEIQAHNQNWAVLQDRKGVLYFANMDGIVEYDGVSWKVIPNANNTVVRSLALSQGDTIFVGAFGDFGYLSSDDSQQTVYRSLAEFLPEDSREFADVWQTLITDEGVYFVSSKIIFRWNGREIKTWKTNYSFHVGFEVNGKFYVRHNRVGLMQMVNGELELVPRGDEFASERIMAILPYGDDMLLITRSNGIVQYADGDIKPFLTEADQIIKSGQAYCATNLPDGNIAIGTLQAGVVVIDKDRKLRFHLNKSTGLQDETILYMQVDRQGGLWLGMHVGVSRVEISSPFTLYASESGLEGSVIEFLKHRNTYYAVTSMGVFGLQDGRSHFQRVSSVSPQGWALLSFGNKLLAGVYDGVYEINGLKGQLIDSAYVMSLHRSAKDTNRLYVGLQRGLKSLYFSNGRWKNEGLYEGVTGEILQIYEDEKGRLWLTERFEGLGLAEFPNGHSRSPVYTHFDTAQGLPSLDKTFAFQYNGSTLFGTSDRFYFFDDKSRRFYPDTVLSKFLPQDIDLYALNIDKQKSLWIIDEPSVAVLNFSSEDATYKLEVTPFQRISSFNSYYAYPDPDHDELVWIGTIDRVVRYDRSIHPNLDNTFPTLIRQVRIGEDSIVFGGFQASPDKIINLSSGVKLFRISYSAPGYDDESQNLYQYFLEGYDTEWSGWTKEHYKDYAGLPSGTYTFNVRAKNIYGEIGQTASFDFYIAPPFYLSWWALLFYILLLGVLIYLLLRRQRRVIQKRYLIELNKVELEKLKELDQLKTNFFANISHEFRTPLTLILSPVEQLLHSKNIDNPRVLYRTIEHNAKRLLRLINQLLDLSKLEAGKMQLHLSVGDIVPLLKAAQGSFEISARQKGVEVVDEIQVSNAWMKIDNQKFEQIVYNLISNAIKYTPPGGKVVIRLFEQNESYILQVADNGEGISSEHLPHIFERFYQGDHAKSSGEPGTGIGLALTSELVQLLGGTIEVTSKQGEGTRFTATFPKSTEQESSVEKIEFQPTVSIPLNDLQEVPVGDKKVDGERSIILLVEDNVEMRTFVRGQLSDQYQVIEAANGQEGVELAIEFSPDLIISDIMMPLKDGLTLCAELKDDERTSHIPIILLTSRADVESRLEGLRRGADDYIAKPFNYQELFLRIRNLLNFRQKLWANLTGTTQESLSKADELDLEIEDQFLTRLRNLVMDHLSDSTLEIDELAKMAGMSRSQLFRKVKILTALSPSVFIRNIRLDQAKILLETSDMNVSEVAYTVGFSSPTYFSDSYNQYFGIRPSQVRK